MPRWNSEILEATGDEKMTGLTLRDTVTVTGDESTMAATGLFIAIGHDPRSELVIGQMAVDDEGYLLVKHPTTETNLRGVFGCGDLVDHRDRQAITAAGTGCAAAGDVEHFLAASGRPTYAQHESALVE